MSYVGAAESLARQGTLRIPVVPWSSPDSTSPLTRFPPGFPAALAVPMRLGLPPLEAARAVTATAAFATIASVVWLMSELAGLRWGILVAAIVLVTPALLELQRRVLSEPLFLAGLLLTIAMMLRTPTRLLAAAMAAAAAGLVRYAGIALTSALALWASGQGKTVRARVRGAIVSLLPAVVVQGVWALRIQREEGRLRVFGVYGDLGNALHGAAVTFVQWLAPWTELRPWRSIAALVMLGAGSLLMVSALRHVTHGNGPGRSRERSVARAFAALSLCGGCYLVVLLVSRLFVDPGVPFDWRTLSPILVLAELSLVLALSVRWQPWRAPQRALAAVMVAAWLAGALWVDLERHEGARTSRSDYAGAAWKNSALVEWIRTEGKRHALFSNNPVVIYFHTGRASRELPKSVDRSSLGAFGSALARHHGAMIGFDHPYIRMAPPADLARGLALREVAWFDDGSVWSPPDSDGARR